MSLILNEAPAETLDHTLPASAVMEHVLFEIKHLIVGQDHLLERLLIALLARGHVLLEGVPGLAKTATIKALAQVVGGSFGRVQFTPDLVPADLTGTRIYNGRTGEFFTEPGPVFANLLLADEINRAPAVDAQGQRLPALVVLLSDGQSSAGMAPSEAAAQAAGARVRVHTVGIGQRGAAPLLGGGQRAELDEATLQAIARQTGGQYFYAAEAGQLEQIYGDLSSQVSWVEERTEITALVGALATVLLLAGGVLSLRWFQQFP